jgi:hypothetical protein
MIKNVEGISKLVEVLDLAVVKWKRAFCVLVLAPMPGQGRCGER